MYGIQRAIFDAIGESLDELNGLVFTRLTVDLPPATLGTVVPPEATTARVESTYGWPESGQVITRGEVITYTGKTGTSLTGLGRDDAVLETYPRGELIALWTEDWSDLDRARRALFAATAEGPFLDVVGRNYGIPRYQGVPDDLYRRLVQVLAFQAGVGTRGAIDEALEVILDGKGLSGTDGVLDAATHRLTSASGGFTVGMRDMRVRLTGAIAQNRRPCRIRDVIDEHTIELDPRGSDYFAPGDVADETDVTFDILPWDVIEDAFRPGKVIIRLNCRGAEDAEGFAYASPGEAATSTDATHVTVQHPIRQVLGVWLATDPDRQSQNYATTNDFSGFIITLDTPLPDAQTDVIVDYGDVDVPETPPSPGIPGDARAVATAHSLGNVPTAVGSTQELVDAELGTILGQYLSPGHWTKTGTDEWTPLSGAPVASASFADAIALGRASVIYPVPPSTALGVRDIHNPGGAAEAVLLSVSAPLERFPLYLGDRVGLLAAFIRVFTVAGFVPIIEIKEW